MKKLLPRRVRAWLYRVIAAAAPLATYYGVVAEHEVSMWLALASALLGVGLAAANTSAKKDDPPAQ